MTYFPQPKPSTLPAASLSASQRIIIYGMGDTALSTTLGALATWAIAYVPIVVATGATTPVTVPGAATIGVPVTGLTSTIAPSGATAYAALFNGIDDATARVAFAGTAVPALTPPAAATYTVHVYSAATGGTLLATSASFVASSSVTYATSYTTTLSANTAEVGVAITMAATPVGGSWPVGVVLTPVKVSLDGTAAPASVSPTGTGIASVTFTAAEAASGTLSFSNASGMTNTTGPLAFTATATEASVSATAYTTTLSSTGGAVGEPMTVSYTPDSGTWPADTTITPSVSGVAGAFSPATVSPSGTAPASLTFTPSGDGTAVLTSANNKSMASTSGSLSYAASTGDGFAPGIYFPSEIWFGGSLNTSDVSIGSGFVRGLSGVPTWSVTGTDASRVSLKSSTQSSSHNASLAGMQMFCGSGMFDKPAGDFNVTVNATDGVTSYTKDIVIHNLAAGVPQMAMGGNVVSDATPPYTYYPTPNGTERMVSFFQLRGMSSGDPVFSDPSGMFQFGVVGGTPTMVFTKPAALPLSDHYGEYPVSFTYNGVVHATKLWIIHEAAPVVSWAVGTTLYDTTPIGAVLGTVSAYTESGGYTFAMGDNPKSSFAVDSSGVVTLKVAPTASDVLDFSVIVTGGTQTTTITVPETVLAGTLLPSSNMTTTFSTSMDNSMTDGTVGTVSVTGIANPSWTIEVLDDECQASTDWLGTPTPRYTITGTGASVSLDFWRLSAQTDQIRINVFNSDGVRCTKTVGLTVAEKVGPTYHVGEAGNGYDFETWNALGDAAWTTPADYLGCTIILHPKANNYAGDFSRMVLGHGTNQQYLPGPYTMRNPVGSNIRTKIDFGGQSPYGAKGGLNRNSFDQHMINLEVCGVSNGHNAGGIYIENNSHGNLHIDGCYVHDCDNGVMGGDKGNRVYVTDTIVAMCGTGDYGLTHNFYIAHATSVTVLRTQSFGTAHVHEFKSRAKRVSITYCHFLDGENGIGSSCLDIPNGGAYEVAHNVFGKTPDIVDSKDANMIQYAHEIGHQEGYPVNTLNFHDNILLNMIAPNSQASGGGNGLACIYANHDPVTGALFEITYTNNQFYHLPFANWTAIKAGVIVTDGGGNVALEEYPAQTIMDPLTSAALTIQPGPAYLNGQNHASYGPLVQVNNNLQMQMAITSAPSLGDIVATMVMYDHEAIATTANTWEMLTSSDGKFSIDSSGNVKVAASSIPDAMYWVQIKCTGTTSYSTSQSATNWKFIPVGTGFMASDAPIIATGATLANFPTSGMQNVPLAMGSATATLTPSGAAAYAVLSVGGVEQGARTMFTDTAPPTLTPTGFGAYTYAVFAAANGGAALATSPTITVADASLLTAATMAGFPTSGMATVPLVMTGATATLTPSTATAYAALIIGGTEDGPRTSFAGSAPPALTPSNSGSYAYAIFSAPSGGTAKATSPTITVAAAPILATGVVLAGFPTAGTSGIALDLSGATVAFTPSGATGYAALITGGTEEGSRTAFMGTMPPAMTPATAASYTYNVFAAANGGSPMATSPAITVARAPLLLDALTVPATAAWSPRKLRADYIGASIRVKRFNDSVEQDVGFVDDELDVASMMAFVGSTQGDVVRIYQQVAGGGPDIVPAPSKKITIVGNNTFFNVGGKPAFLLESHTYRYANSESSIAVGGNLLSSYIVATTKNDTAIASQLLAFVADGDGDATGSATSAMLVMLDGSEGKLRATRNGVTATAPTVQSSDGFTAATVYDGTNETLYVNGSQAAQAASTGNFGATGSIKIGYSGSGGANDIWDGRFGELIVQAGANSTDRATIQASQKAYWGTP